MTVHEPYYQGGHGKWRAEVPINGKSSPWLSSRLAAKCWLLVREDRLRPLVEAKTQIIGVTRRSS